MSLAISSSVRDLMRVPWVTKVASEIILCRLVLLPPKSVYSVCVSKRPTLAPRRKQPESLALPSAESTIRVRVLCQAIGLKDHREWTRSRFTISIKVRDIVGCRQQWLKSLLGSQSEVQSYALKDHIRLSFDGLNHWCLLAAIRLLLWVRMHTMLDSLLLQQFTT